MDTIITIINNTPDSIRFGIMSYYPNMIEVIAHLLEAAGYIVWEDGTVSKP